MTAKRRKKTVWLSSKFILPLVTTVAFFILWETTTAVFEIPSFLVPAPSEVLVTTWVYRAPIWLHAYQTLFTTLVGLGVAVIIGIILGVAIGSSQRVYEALNPLLVGFNSIPKVAFVPVFVLWFGIGTVPAILTAIVISFFPIVVNVAAGLATVEPELRDVLRSLGATRRDILLKVGFPRSLPYFFAALKISVTLAFVGSVLSETVASNKGIGYLMMSASTNLNMQLVFAGLIVTAVMGIALYFAIDLFERRLLHWALRANK